MRILIVDDSRSIQKSVSWRIQKLGHTVLGLGSDGNEGAALYKAHQPDLTLLDITMPNKDGRECLKEILAINPSAKVVMLSAVGNPEVIEECLQIGALAFIDKSQMMKGDFLERKIEEICKSIKAVAA